MARYILYLAVVLGAAYSIPPIRERIDAPTVRAWAHITPHFRFITDRVRRGLAEREETAIARFLREEHALGHALPEADGFQAWMQQHLEVGRDPWDNQYFLVVKDEGSMVVGSSGPDGKRGTPDDVVTPCTW
jgi:hypothetical protein